jgi:NAD dependent epimerase/dehydratase family enzyme/predicted DCC family thiol-disulfide oxidoreductase YuxK
MAASVGSLIARLDRQPEVLINASAIGYYGDRAETVLGEDDAAGSGFLAEVCGQWEAAAERAGTRGVRVCRMRIGLVLGPCGGLLQPLALAARFGAATVLGDGRQWQSWIHLDDLVRLLVHAMDRTSMRGAINAVAPEAVTQRMFTQRLAATLHRPARLRVPAPFLRALPGGMSELFLGSQRIEPRAALAGDFRFRYPQLDAALRNILVPPSSPVTTVAVYVNDACPVCHAEMDRYRVESQHERRGITFCSIDSGFPGLPAYGLSASDLRRRLFVYTSDGRLRSGMDAMRAIWRDLPSLRWLARIAGLPGIRHLADFIYDLVLAPGLDAWNRRRGAYSTSTAVTSHTGLRTPR